MTDNPKQRGPGRPRKGDMAKTRIIGVRVSEADHDLIEQAAREDADSKPAPWVRRIALDRAREIVGGDDET